MGETFLCNLPLRRKTMKKCFLAAVAVLALADNANAMYALCTVKQDGEASNRPGGNSYFFVKKGDQVEIQDAYKDFVFIRHLYGFSPDREDFEQFGWVKENTLKCEGSH